MTLCAGFGEGLEASTRRGAVGRQVKHIYRRLILSRTMLESIPQHLPTQLPTITANRHRSFDNRAEFPTMCVSDSYPTSIGILPKVYLL